MEWNETKEKQQKDKKGNITGTHTDTKASDADAEWRAVPKSSLCTREASPERARPVPRYSISPVFFSCF